MQLNSYVSIEVLPLPNHAIITANPPERLIKATVLAPSQNNECDLEPGMIVAFQRQNVINVDGKGFIHEDNIEMITTAETEIA